MCLTLCFLWIALSRGFCCLMRAINKSMNDIHHPSSSVLSNTTFLTMEVFCIWGQLGGGGGGDCMWFTDPLGYYGARILGRLENAIFYFAFSLGERKEVQWLQISAVQQNFLWQWKCCLFVLSSTEATSSVWLLRRGNIASATEEVNFKSYFI